MDKITKEQRSKNMAAIKSKSNLEDIVSKKLWSRGVRFKRNVRSLKGTPDIAIRKYKLVIFIDSCFWHCCPEHGNIPKSNINYWMKKLCRNKERDREVTDYYHMQNWVILRFWEHEIKQDLDGVIDVIINYLEEQISI